MSDFVKQIGRLTIEYHKDYGSNSCVHVMCRKGWNDFCPVETFELSLEEVKDLWFALDRLYEHATR